MRKTIEEREEEDFFFRGEPEDRGGRLRERRRGVLEKFWLIF